MVLVAGQDLQQGYTNKNPPADHLVTELTKVC